MFDNRMLKNNKYDEMMVDIGEQKFKIQLMLGEFIFDILNEFDHHIKNVEIPVMISIDNEFFTLNCTEIFYDNDNEIVKIKINEIEDSLEWGELDLFSQETIVNFVHARYISEQLYKNFSSDNDLH